MFNEAFQALPLSAAITNGQGIIVATNRAWREFSLWNEGPEHGFLERNYIDACEGDDPATRQVAQGLKELLGGERDSLSVEYPCHSPDEKRWFLLQAGRFDVDGEIHLLVTHTNITRRRLAEEAARREADHDELTGLLTRKTFLQRISQALRRAERNGTRVGVFFLDLDGFKEINDTLGHHAGDRALREIADRLRGCLRRSDGLARAGGDEFLVFAEEIDSGTARRITERIHGVFREKIEVGAARRRLSCSVGVSFYPLDGEEPETLMRAADRAMYAAKAGGAGRTEYAGNSPDSG